MVGKRPIRAVLARTGWLRPMTGSWMHQRPNSFGLTLTCATAWGNGGRDCGRKFVQAKNNSHWPIA